MFSDKTLKAAGDGKGHAQRGTMFIGETLHIDVDSKNESISDKKKTWVYILLTAFVGKWKFSFKKKWFNEKAWKKVGKKFLKT